MKFEPPKTIDYSESDHQKLCVEYAAKAGWGHLLICIPNGAHLAGDAKARARQMNHLKAMGLREGASDLFLAMPNPVLCQKNNYKLYHGAWFEMKKVGARAPGAAQTAFLLSMDRQGYYVDVCYGFGDWADSVQRYLRGLETLWGAEDNTV